MFNRRTLLALSLTAIAASLTTMAPVSDAAAAKVTFSPAKFAQYKASGKGFMLDFYAPWCGTCRAQSKVISKLQKNDSSLSGLTIMKVDWDTWRSKKVTRDLKIPRRSTLVMFKGGREVGRVVAQTSTGAIKALMKKGL